ncbi:hypothetical protein, unlikely [Trypanosoma brucei gambiense DAL972]|uniref:Uncharacterized protein n=1 Tax=Trypanosoma brucei gambiense (strain MHOM/CI/86/DAL972) TaxID=679716 RepID=D0A8K1_TRYB9|nr:hypothetical protein, unlikely [Trypanosoma brucei gambiense DAL972]CBH18002.1 hypothetical protein, unlikely [Trypanosoma brucei gambiense DAL972]|eukprot:XP_011780266.1 hypothetical protein, unlikely [Trypanosoma brucei gambiense DAL972]
MQYFHTPLPLLIFILLYFSSRQCVRMANFFLFSLRKIFFLWSVGFPPFYAFICCSHVSVRSERRLIMRGRGMMWVYQFGSRLPLISFLFLFFFIFIFYVLV